jgi:hypothetical protein
MDNTYLGNNTLILTAGEPAPLSYHMGKNVYGSYDDIKLVANNNDGWKRQPSNPGLKNGPKIVYQGTPLPLKDEVVYQYPPKDSMFYFTQNYASPACQGTYASDMGGVCTTPQQRKFVGQQRGNNKNWPSGSF